MEPHKSMLKFRLPWEKGSRKKYLDGLVFLPVWGCKTTTECRLVPTSGEKEWDCTYFYEQLFYFNTNTRVSYYPHDVVVRNFLFVWFLMLISSFSSCLLFRLISANSYFFVYFEFL